MRVERTSGISSALPLRNPDAIREREHPFPSRQEETAHSASRVLEEIAAQFDMRDMSTDEALHLANRLMQEELLTATGYICLTGVPMRLVPGEGCHALRSGRSGNQRYNYIDEFERYVAFELTEQNSAAAEQLQTVLDLLCSLDTLRQNGPVDLSV
ncbi:MAG TPA: hypothetical protein VM554_02095 [Acidisarcina sp.]|nr:hypothetical protein [Acidisarcina sp.]